jgi:SsrA-binding protein
MTSGEKMAEEFKLIAKNRQARFQYEVEETFEAGLVLQGTEVKSLRQGRVNLKDGYAHVKAGELWLENVHISPYPWAHYGNHEPLRRRKLLVHKHELRRLVGKVAERGYALVPLAMYFKKGRAKVELALAKGKKLHDKRQTIKEREDNREAERAIRHRED